jgi:hypothetical protein
MKKIYLILSVFAIVFAACETDFDVNAQWEESTVVYGLLDAGKELQQIKIGKAFLGQMDAMQMAQYADSINFDENELAVKVVRINNNGNTDTIILDEVPTLRNEGDFNDSIIVYTFEKSNVWFKVNSEYELLIKNNITGNEVSSTTNVISGFDFDNIYRTITNDKPTFPFGFFNSNGDFSPSTITWDDSNDNGKIYQLDLVINYSDSNIISGVVSSEQLVFSQPLVDGKEKKMRIEGESFFNFLRLNLGKDNDKVRYFNGIDLVMIVGSEDLETYVKVNKPISGIVQERPQFTNINNGIGLFSSRFSKVRYGYNLTDCTIKYLIEDLDRGFIATQSYNCP